MRVVGSQAGGRVSFPAADVAAVMGALPLSTQQVAGLAARIRIPAQEGGGLDPPEPKSSVHAMHQAVGDDEEDAVPLTMTADGKISSQRKAKETEESVYRRYLLTMEKLAAAEQLESMGKTADATA
eukprot:1188161-Prorocentrum_minimum.AAC.2